MHSTYTVCVWHGNGGNTKQSILTAMATYPQMCWPMNITRKYWFTYLESAAENSSGMCLASAGSIVTAVFCKLTVLGRWNCLTCLLTMTMDHMMPLDTTNTCWLWFRIHLCTKHNTCLGVFRGQFWLSNQKILKYQQFEKEIQRLTDQKLLEALVLCPIPHVLHCKKSFWELHHDPNFLFWSLGVMLYIVGRIICSWSHDPRSTATLVLMTPTQGSCQPAQWCLTIWLIFGVCLLSRLCFLNMQQQLLLCPSMCLTNSTNFTLPSFPP